MSCTSKVIALLRLKMYIVTIQRGFLLHVTFDIILILIFFIIFLNYKNTFIMHVWIIS